MVIEILFNEVCSLFGDSQNAAYLKATLPEAELIYTPITEPPYFVDHKPDMIYLGAMTENTQRRVLNKLMPLKARIEELVDAGVPFLATGNAADLFCRSIDCVTEES